MKQGGRGCSLDRPLWPGPGPGEEPRGGDQPILPLRAKEGHPQVRPQAGNASAPLASPPVPLLSPPPHCHGTLSPCHPPCPLPSPPDPLSQVLPTLLVLLLTCRPAKHARVTANTLASVTSCLTSRLWPVCRSRDGSGHHCSSAAMCQLTITIHLRISPEAAQGSK